MDQMTNRSSDRLPASTDFCQAYLVLCKTLPSGICTTLNASLTMSA